MYTLLIIEDEHLIRKWLRYAIDYESLDIIIVAEARDGKEGYDAIIKYKPDIVLTDINMPVMTAFDMFKSTKAINYQKIILSGYSDFENARLALRYGAVEFLTKPINKDELYFCLQEMIQNLKVIQKNSDQQYWNLNPVDNKLSPVINQITNWIQKHYDQKIIINDIARDLGYSESYLYQLMKKHLNITISDYINQYRISMAMKYLINQPDILVYQLSEKVGIGDYRYFDRVFKKYVGLTVKDFRQSIQKGSIKGKVTCQKEES